MCLHSVARSSINYCFCWTDRYVILGNHRDAWVFGSLDPSSGTAVMMEVSRVLGEMLQQGISSITGGVLSEELFFASF